MHRVPPPVAVQSLRRQGTGGEDQDHHGNKLCPFCLLHNADEICFSKINKSKPVCEELSCKGQHIKWLHEMLKEIPCKSKEKEGKVNVVQREGGWRTPEDTWIEMEEAEEEVGPP